MSLWESQKAEVRAVLEIENLRHPQEVVELLMKVADPNELAAYLEDLANYYIHEEGAEDVEVRKHGRRLLTVVADLRRRR